MCYILFMINIGQNIYLWRVFKELSQEELAASSGVPRPNLSVIESGKRDLTVTTLRKIARPLGVSAGELLDGIAPVNFNSCASSREDQDAIIRASFGDKTVHLSRKQKMLSLMLANIAHDKINLFRYKLRGNLLKNKSYIKDWLLLKAGLEPALLNKLLSLLEKYSVFFGRGL